MAKNALWAVAVITTALLYSMWPDILKLQGVLPDLILTAVVFFAVAEGEERAMFTGLLGGIYNDVVSDSTLGHHVLGLVLVGYAAARISTRLITEHPAVKAGLVFCAALIQGVLYTAVLYVQRPDVPFVNDIINKVIPEAFYTGVFSPILFLIYGWIFHGREAFAGGKAR